MITDRQLKEAITHLTHPDVPSYACVFFEVDPLNIKEIKYKQTRAYYHAHKMELNCTVRIIGARLYIFKLWNTGV